MKIRQNNRIIVVRSGDSVATIATTANKAGLLPSQIMRLLGLIARIRKQAVDAAAHTQREANLALAARCSGGNAVGKAYRLQKAAAAAARGRAGELFDELSANFPNVKYVG